MGSRHWVRLLTGMALAAAGCTDVTAIRIDGSSTVYPISALITEMYAEQNAGTRITAAFSGTGGGMKKFIAGEIDICDASRAIKDIERKSCQENGVEFIELEVA